MVIRSVERLTRMVLVIFIVFVKFEWRKLFLSTGSAGGERERYGLFLVKQKESYSFTKNSLSL